MYQSAALLPCLPKLLWCDTMETLFLGWWTCCEDMPAKHLSFIEGLDSLTVQDECLLFNCQWWDAFVAIFYHLFSMTASVKNLLFVQLNQDRFGLTHHNDWKQGRIPCHSSNALFDKITLEQIKATVGVSLYLLTPFLYYNLKQSCHIL